MEKRNKKLNQLKNQGFTLIEVLVAVAIFTAIIGGVVIFGVRTIEAYSKSKAMQNSLDNARYSIESLSKKIRTSRNIDSDVDTELFIIDNLDYSRHCYRFFDDNGMKLQMAEAPESSGYADCDDFVNGGASFDNLVGIDDRITATGFFDVKPTEFGADPKRGFVRISITIEYGDGTVSPSEKDKVTIQSGVSLRDYEVPGVD